MRYMPTKARYLCSCGCSLFNAGLGVLDLLEPPHLCRLFPPPPLPPKTLHFPPSPTLASLTPSPHSIPERPNPAPSPPSPRGSKMRIWAQRAVGARKGELSSGSGLAFENLSYKETICAGI
jgi:hypothetical protein